MDNGADHVMSPCLSHFLSVGPSQLSGIQVAGRDMVLPVLGEGTIVFDLGGGKLFPIPHCQYVPDLVGPLLSVGVLEDMGLTTVLGPDSHYVVDTAAGEVVFEIERLAVKSGNPGLYYLPYSALEFSDSVRSTSGSGSAMAVSGSRTNESSGDWSLWHSRMGHLSQGDLSTLIDHQAVTGAKFTSTRPANKDKCFFCVNGKMAQTPFVKGSTAKFKPALLGLLHMDLMGPMEVDSVREYRYILVVVDDFSRYCWVRCLKSKDETETALTEDIFPLAERRLNRKIQSFRSDRGGEFLSSEFTDWCRVRGISHNLTAPYTPQQNGLAEVSNRILQEKFRCMLSESGLPLRYWDFAVEYACWLKNRSPAAALKLGETPSGVMYGSPPSIALARVFGCVSQVWVPRQIRQGKLGPRARWGIFLGVAKRSKAWQFLMLDKNSLFVSRNAFFHEELFWPKWKMYMSDRGELDGFAVEIEPGVSHPGDATQESVDPADADADRDAVPATGRSPRSPNSSAEAWYLRVLNGGSGGSADEGDHPAVEVVAPQLGQERPIPHQGADESLTGTDNHVSNLGGVGVSVEFPVELETCADTTGLGDAVESHVAVDVESSVSSAETETGLESHDLDPQESVEIRLPGFGLGGPGLQADLAEESDSGSAAPDRETSLPGPLLSSDVVTDSRFAERYPVRIRKPARGMRSDGQGGYFGYAKLAKRMQKFLAEDEFCLTPCTLGYAYAGQGERTPDLYYTEPKRYKDAVVDKYSKEWKHAMDKEYQQIVDRGVFKLVDLKPGQKLMTGRWVYKVKRNVDGTLEKFKCRFVVQGFKADPGIHYSETYAPTAEMATARMLLALATLFDWEVEQMDVSGAFLYGPIVEEIYMTPPEGYGDNSGKVWKLEKALYGLKQAPRQWNLKLHEVLTSMAFKQSCHDPSLYTLVRDGVTLYLLDFVDDMLLVCPSKSLVESVKKELSTKFEMSDLGATKKYLGWHIQRDRKTREMWLSGEMKIMDTVRTFGMEHAECPDTPLPNGFQTFLPHEMDPSDPDRKPEADSKDKFSPLLSAVDHSKYRSLVGGLQYFAQSLRPDVAYAANCLAQASNQPRERHWNAALYALRYLKGTAKLGIHYSASKGSQLVCYSDSDYAGCHGSRKSTSGSMCMIAGGPVSWRSKKQSVVTLSTTEAEFRALTAVVTDSMWLRGLCAEFGHAQAGPTPVYCDNEGAVKLSKNPVYRAKTKHVAVSFMFVRQEQERKTVHVVYVPTSKQAADFLTKRVQPAQFKACVSICGLTVQR